MKRKSIIVALLVALWLILPVMAYAAQVGKFTKIEGNVDVTSPGKEAAPARLGDALTAGDIIRTKSKAKCEVAFIDGSILRLAESTRLRVGEFTQEKEQRNATLNLFRGKIQNVVKTIAGAAATQSKYEIHTPTAVAGVRGTNFFVYHQAGVSGAIFKEGTGYGYSLNRPQDVRTINPGQAMVVVSADLPPTVRSATPAEMDQHQKDTAPAEKPKEEGKKEEEKKPDEAVAKADEGKKEEEKKEEKTEKGEAKTEQKAEEKPGEAKQAEKTAAEPQKVVEASATAAEKERSVPVEIVGKSSGETAALTTSTLYQATDFSSGSSGAGATGLGSSTVTTVTSNVGKTDTVKTSDIITNIVPQSQDTIPPEIKLSLTPRIPKAAAAAYALPSNARALLIPSGGFEAVFLLSSPELSSFSYLRTGTNPDGTKTVGTWSPLSVPTKEFSFTLGNLTEGYHTFKITGTDASKNETTFEFTISGLALERIAEAGAVFQLTANGPGKDSIKTLQITDAGGKVLSPASAPWVTEITASANVSIVAFFSSKPAAISNASAPTFTVASTKEGVSYRYSLDGTNYISATGNTIIPSGLKEGSNTLYIKATDQPGNVSPTTSYTWTVDTVPPAITLTGTPAATTKANSANIGVSATDATAVTYTYKLDSNVVPSSDLTNIPEGNRVFTVVATDAAGNETTTTYSWTTDYTAPVAAIGPAASPDLSGAKLTSVTAAFSANESSTYSYSIDGGPLTSTGSSLTLPGLAEGSHTLSYRATDPAGNTATNSLTFSLSRYSLTGNVADGGTIGSVTAGEVAGVSNQSWGGWSISMGGSVEGPPPALFTAAAGGRSTDTVTAGNDGGYWLESIEGTYDGVSALSGESALMYLSSDRVGGGYGAFTGSYSAASNSWQATDSGAGAYSEIPLAFGGGLSGAFFYHDYDSGLISENDITGLMGGIADFWTNSAPFAVMMGEYNNPGDRTLWGINATGASLSGAGYSGLIGGIALNGALESMYIAFYIKPDGTTGYLTSNDIVGEFLPGIGMWVAEGSLTSVPMGSTSVKPSELAVLPSYPYDGGPYRYGENHTVIAGDIMGSYAPGVTNFSAASLNDQNWGIWLWSGGGAYSSAPPPNWKAVIGFGAGDNVYDPLLNYDFANAYGILNITGSSWSDSKLTGAIDITSSKILTPTTLTTFLTGDLLGTYDTTDNTWQAISGGAWTEKPLTFMSEVYPDRYNAVKEYNGAYNFSGGGYYYYTYNGNNSFGYLYSRPTSSDYPSTTTYYYDDGTTYTSGYDASGAYTTSSGTWDPQTFSLSSLATAPTPTGETAALAYQYENLDSNWIGDLYGIMGGTQSLWYEADGTTINTTKTGVPVTVMGEYYRDADYATLGNNIWYTDYLYSSNYKDDTDTTYDGGAYQGFMGGIETPSLSGSERPLEGGLIALYIDPAGNAGYLKGSLAGKAYPDIEMFEMDGLINRTQVATASEVGVSAPDLTDSTHWGYMDVYGLAGQFKDGTTAAGSITGDYDYGDTLSIANWTTNTPQSWGIYGLTLYGGYDTPASTSWTARLGGDGDFGAYNLYNRYYGRYNYSNGDYYNYEYNTDNSYGYKKYYFGADGSNTRTYYYSDGETYTYNSSTGSSYGTWDPSAFDLAGLAASPAPPTDVTVSLSYSYDYGSGDDDWGYWLAGINNGAAVDGKLTGEVTGRFITYTKLGTINGDLLGTYNSTDNTWEAVSLGKWSGAPLSFVSDISADLRATARYYEASYSYADGGYYSYNYYTDNHDGYVRYYRPDGLNYYTYYYDDGTTYTYDYNTGTSVGGIWGTDPGTTIASLVGTPPDAKYASSSSDDYPVSYGDGWMDGLMGGAASLWTATKTSPASVTMMGEYSPYSNVPHVWTAEIYSYNYLQDNYTTYDGGAYRGFLGGTEIGGSLEGGLLALYIDPDGHRGYLMGSLTGTAYPEIEMFEMEGGIYPTEVDSLHTGIAPENLYDSIWESYSYYYYYGNLAGKFDNGGTIKAGYSYGEGYYWWDDMATMSIVNYEKNKSAPWGIYAQSMFGTYTNPGATWTAKTGGESPFGAYNVANYHYGNYSYADEGSYNYNYYTDNRSGYVSYSRPGGDHYYTHYYGDGTTHTYDYNTGNDTSGRWDTVPETTIASLVKTPIDSANAVLSDKDKYGVGEDDYGYWLADISDGTWSGNGLTGKLSGKFITYTKLGAMAGEVLGVYNTTDNTWQAISGGVWSGTTLSFVSDVSADLRATARYYEASYSYADEGYYSYNYYTDNHEGYVRYYRPDGLNYDTYYYDDGTTYTYDYNTDTSTDGRWDTDPETTIASLVGTPVDSANAALSYNDDYPVSYGDGWMDGLMGGAASLWTATQISPASVTMMGRYNPYSKVPHVWATEIYSYNYLQDNYTTYDGGAYRGYLGGTEIGGSMEGGLLALYIDPSGNAGYLKGSLSGTAYPEIEMFEMEGGLHPVQMVTGIGILPADLYNAISVTNETWGTVNDFKFNSTAMGPDSGRDYNYYEDSAKIGSSNWWGIWSASIDGVYDGITASDNWSWSMEYRDGNKVIGHETTGTQWSNNKIAGAEAGYWAEISSASAVTGISVGEIRGAFDPNASTLQAVSAGVWLETNKFLEMAGTNPAALQKLNIPAVQVGKTTLTQASGTVNNLSGVTMSDVTFFATSTGAPPKIWATGNVSGSYTAAPAIGTGVNLTGGGLSATFTPQVWNTTDNKWLSTVNGTGGFNGSTVFRGAGAGIIAPGAGTAGAISGTAAGVAK